MSLHKGGKNKLEPENTISCPSGTAAAATVAHSHYSHFALSAEQNKYYK